MTKKKLLAFFIPVSLLLCSCDPSCSMDPYDYNACTVANKTSDSLWVVWYSADRYDKNCDTVKLAPKEEAPVYTFGCGRYSYESKPGCLYFIGQGAYNMDKPIFDSIAFYVRDSLMSIYYPPMRDMGDTNSFFNRYSWTEQEIDERNGKSTFTYTEADFGHRF
ncbi:MAG: hypothetical protein IJL38_01040 [Bacteroidales bacterium]|nr:hypothetical protein [Bacteroidales bacterium]